MSLAELLRPRRRRVSKKYDTAASGASNLSQEEHLLIFLWPQLLSTDLEHADPAVWEILQNVCNSYSNYLLQSIRIATDYIGPIGEEKTKAFHQLDPLRKFHVTGCPRCSRKCYAKQIL